MFSCYYCIFILVRSAYNFPTGLTGFSLPSTEFIEVIYSKTTVGEIAPVTRRFLRDFIGNPYSTRQTVD